MNINISTCDRSEVEAMTDLEKQCHAWAWLREMFASQCKDFIQEQRQAYRQSIIDTGAPERCLPGGESYIPSTKIKQGHPQYEAFKEINRIWLYNFDGSLTWAVGCNRGKRAGSASGVINISPTGSTQTLHKLLGKSLGKSEAMFAIELSHAVGLLHGKATDMIEGSPAKGSKIADAAITMDHINDNHHDNRIENLQLLTHLDNLLKQHGWKWDLNDLREIRFLWGNRYVTPITQTELATRFGCKQQHISDIVNLKTRLESEHTLTDPDRLFVDCEDTKALRNVHTINIGGKPFQATPRAFDCEDEPFTFAHKVLTTIDPNQTILRISEPDPGDEAVLAELQEWKRGSND